MSFFIFHVAACSPDSGFTELPLDKSSYSDPYAYEHNGLLEGDGDGDGNGDNGCRFCCDTYAEPPPSYSRSFLARQQRSRRAPRGCKKLLLSLAHLLCYCRSRRRYQLLTRYRYAKQKKPYSAISVLVEQLTSETYEEDDLAGVPDLLEAIKLQATGPTEAARAVRKKLKYGSVHRQLRALAILDGLLQNGPPRTQRALLADAPLLERLRIAATDPVSDVDVRNKCKDLFSQWVASAKTNPGLEGAASLYNALPRQKKPMTAQQRREQSRVLRETEEDVAREAAAADGRDEAGSRSGSLVSSPAPTPANTLRKSSTPTSPVTLSISSTFGMDKKSKKAAKNKGRVLFNLDREKPAILQSIAASSVASTNLLNGLKLVNRETTSVSSEPEVMKRFETCKQLRRQILRYIQYVETDELLGGLIHANEELVEALMAFEVLDKSVVDDSDSEVEEAAHQSREARKRDEADARDAAKAVAAMSLHPEQAPPRPTRPDVGSPRGFRGGTTTDRLAPPVGLSFTSSAPPTGRRPQQQGSRPKGKAPFDEEDDYESDYDDDDDEDDDDDDNNPFGDRNATRTPDPESVTTVNANAAPVRGTSTNIGSGARRAPYGFREV